MSAIIVISLNKEIADYKRVRSQAIKEGIAIGYKQGNNGYNDGYAKGKEEERREGIGGGYKLGQKNREIPIYCLTCYIPREILQGS